MRQCRRISDHLQRRRKVGLVHPVYYRVSGVQQRSYDGKQYANHHCDPSVFDGHYLPPILRDKLTRVECFPISTPSD